MVKKLLLIISLLFYVITVIQVSPIGGNSETTVFTLMKQVYDIGNFKKKGLARSDPYLLHFRNHSFVETAHRFDYRYDQIMLFVVNFHFNITSAVSFLKELYFPEFAIRYKYNFDVIFVGPASADPSVVLLNNLPEKGYYAYHSAAVAYNYLLTKKYKYAGIFFMNDDSCVEPTLLNDYDHTKSMRSNLNPWTPGRAWQWNYMKNENNISYPVALDTAMMSIKSKSVVEEKCPYYRGEKWCGWSDFFFIAKKDIPLFLILEEAMYEKLSFLELAVPNMMACLNATQIVECNHGPMKYIKTCVHLHPVKYSMIKNQELCMSRIRREVVDAKPYSPY